MPPQDRDHAVEQWLRQTPITGARADACLDAETLAAWTEGTLDPSLRSMAEAHAATCGRCQEMLAIMLRTTPVATASAGSPVRKWLMMLGPALAAATAVALWIGVGRRPGPPAVDTLAKQHAVEERTIAPPSEGAAPMREKDGKARDDSSSDRVAKELPEARLGAVNEAGADKTDRREPASPAGAKPNDDERLRATVEKAPPTAAAPVPAPVAASPPPPAPAPVSTVADAVLVPEQANKALQDQLPRQSQNQNAANQAPQAQNSVNQGQLNQAPQNQAPGSQSGQQQPARSQQEVVTVTAESPVIQTQAARTAPEAKAEAGRGGSMQGFAGGRLDTGPTFDVAVLDRKAQWRVVEGRLVQRSLDQGRSWSTQYAIDAGPGRINAGICPAAAVCWLAGRSGLVLRTTDGQNWQRLAFSQDIELTSVSSADARTATVSAADGRRFVTTDGGRTWVQQ